MSFIAKLFHEENYDYGVLDVVCSPLSTILPKQNGKAFGQDKIISQMMRGIFKHRLSLPKYTVLYDPDVILKYMNHLPENEQLNLEMLKHQNQEDIRNYVIYIKFPENPKICIIACIEEYKKRTLLLRNHSTGNGKQFVISHAPPHNPVSSATIGKYIKTFVKLAQIDIILFTPHSMRSSSISKANNAGLIIKDIQKAVAIIHKITENNSSFHVK